MQKKDRKQIKRGALKLFRLNTQNLFAYSTGNETVGCVWILLLDGQWQSIPASYFWAEFSLISSKEVRVSRLQATLLVDINWKTEEGAECIPKGTVFCWDENSASQVIDGALVWVDDLEVDIVEVD
jgi:hypothetical protein